MRIVVTISPNVSVIWQLRIIQIILRTPSIQYDVQIDIQWVVILYTYCGRFYIHTGVFLIDIQWVVFIDIQWVVLL